MIAKTMRPGHALAALVPMALRVLVAFDTVALLFASGVHLIGAHIPLGFATFAEAQILPAGIVEGICGVVFAVALFAALTQQAWWWGATLAAHGVGALGYLLGLFATSNGTTPFNYADHRVMLALFAIGIILLLLPAGRGRGTQA